MTDLPNVSNGVCDWRSPFDRKIENQFKQLSPDAHDLIRLATGGRTAEQVRDISIFINDTLQLAEVSAKSIFGSKAKPEIALAIFGHIMDRLAAVDVAAEEARRREEARQRMIEFGIIEPE